MIRVLLRVMPSGTGMVVLPAPSKVAPLKPKVLAEAPGRPGSWLTELPLNCSIPPVTGWPLASRTDTVS